MIGFLVWLLIFWSLNKIFNAVKQIKEERNEAQEKLKKAQDDVELYAEDAERLREELDKANEETRRNLELCKLAYERIDEDFKELTIEEFESYIYFTDGKLDDN